MHLRRYWPDIPYIDLDKEEIPEQYTKYSTVHRPRQGDDTISVKQGRYSTVHRHSGGKMRGKGKKKGE